MKQYTRKQIENFKIRDVCRSDWYPEYDGKVAIFVPIKDRLKSIKGKWWIEGRDFEITD